METTIKLKCPVAGMEKVTVTFNMMASRKQVNTFIESKGEERENVILSVDGWNEEEWGDDPFGEDAPMAFHIWVIGRGIRAAIVGYGTDPNFNTGSSRSTRRTNAVTSSARQTTT